MKAIIITIAYNAEKTIRRTIKSVLAQSFSDFVYYIVDNGSTDKTPKIASEFAKQDSRIVIITKPKNNIWEFFEVLPVILKNHNPSDYLCTLDADDEYNPEFLEKMIKFARQNSLDIVACGNEYINAHNGKKTGAREVDKDIFLKNEYFGHTFMAYHQFMRTIWGKIYSVALLLEAEFKPRYEMGYGGDTVFCIEAFSRAKCVGILSGTLHKYYISIKSASYQFNEKRIISDQILFEMTNEFLILKAGFVSEDNGYFILYTYLCAINDTIKLIIHSDLPTSKKLINIIEIFKNKCTIQLISTKEIEKNKKAKETKQGLFESVIKWLLSLNEVPDELVESYCEVGEILCAAIGYEEGWLFFKRIIIINLIENSRLVQARPKLYELLGLLPNDEQLLLYAQNI